MDGGVDVGVAGHSCTSLLLDPLLTRALHSGTGLIVASNPIYLALISNCFEQISVTFIVVLHQIRFISVFSLRSYLKI